MGDSEIPGLEKLVDWTDISSNATGFFDTEAYSNRVLCGTLYKYADAPKASEWMLL